MKNSLKKIKQFVKQFSLIHIWIIIQNFHFVFQNIYVKFCPNFYYIFILGIQIFFINFLALISIYIKKMNKKKIIVQIYQIGFNSND